jgi:hypothetical protein
VEKKAKKSRFAKLTKEKDKKRLHSAVRPILLIFSGTFDDFRKFSLFSKDKE